MITAIHSIKLDDFQKEIKKLSHLCIATTHQDDSYFSFSFQVLSEYLSWVESNQDSNSVADPWKCSYKAAVNTGE